MPAGTANRATLRLLGGGDLGRGLDAEDAELVAAGEGKSAKGQDQGFLHE